MIYRTFLHIVFFLKGFLLKRISPSRGHEFPHRTSRRW
uniref:Uncharacterized protein n=1 Tax=Setaria italica TaxID=4555 RepID=K3ZFQ0_SETIT